MYTPRGIGPQHVICICTLFAEYRNAHSEATYIGTHVCWLSCTRSNKCEKVGDGASRLRPISLPTPLLQCLFVPGLNICAEIKTVYLASKLCPSFMPQSQPNTCFLIPFSGDNLPNLSVSDKAVQLRFSPGLYEQHWHQAKCLFSRTLHPKSL